VDRPVILLHPANDLLPIRPSPLASAGVVLLADDREGTADSVERLMETKTEARFAFISDKAEFASDGLLDV
jgi:hypothetical protein